MKLVAVGADAVGVVAIGQLATGVVAIGQLATGVIAVGQLSRGVVAVGQLSVGVVSLGQLAVGLAWAGGMLGLAPVTPGWLLAPELLGRLPLRSLLRVRLGDLVPRPRRGLARAGATVAAIAAAAVVIGVALVPLAHELVRTGGILRPPTRLR